MTLRVPRGGLVSWGIFTFVPGRSKPLQGLQLTAPTTHSAVAGKLFKVDQAGHGVVPLDYTLPYEYLIAPTGTLHYVQTHFDALVALWSTQQTQLLTCYAAGSSSDQITGQARLESLTEVGGQPNAMTLNLVFFCEGGMS